MQALTPSFVFQYEKRMRAIQEEEFSRMLLAENNWWAKVAKTMPTDGASERLTWFLNTAEIRGVGDGGSVPFEPLVTQSTEITVERFAAGTKVKKDSLLDLRGGGLDILAEWSRQIGVKMAYQPQKLVSELIMNGAATDGSATAYDGVPFFADNLTSNAFGGVTIFGHPLNPYNPLAGGYVNWLHGSSATVTQTGAANYTYPGALPVDTSVDISTAFNNFSKLIAFVGGLKMPDGKTPRYLKPRAIMAPPALIPRLTQLLNAKFIAQAVGSAGGSANVEATVMRWGINELIEAQELAATTSYATEIFQAAQAATSQASGVRKKYTPTVSGNDTTYYLILEQSMSSQLGSLIHMVREPFKVNYFFGESSTGATGIDAILNRALEIEYICQGRMSGQYGHPYGILRVDGS